LVRLRRQELLPFVIGLDEFDDRAYVDLLRHEQTPGWSGSRQMRDILAYVLVEEQGRRSGRNAPPPDYKAVEMCCSVGRVGLPRS
jgi:hypothetical protein